MSFKFTYSFALLFLLLSLGKSATAYVIPNHVTINKKSGQANSTISPVIFTVTFSEQIVISTFTTGSIILSGTATNKKVISITQVAPYDRTTFDLMVTADNDGTVFATLPANTTTPSNFESTSSDNGYVLPVNLLHFTAVSKECTTILNWQSSGEINNSYYGIETSADGKAFAEAGRVASKNIAAGAIYTYPVKEIANGTTYYRLKMVDKDGKFSYSKTVTVIANGNCGAGLKLKLSPNPVKDFILVEGIVKGNNLSILNAAGITVFSMEATGNTQRINISKFAKGTYMLRVKAADGSMHTIKFIK